MSRYVFFGLALLLSHLPDRLHAAIAVALALPGLADQGTAWGVPPLDWLWYYPFFALGTRRPDSCGGRRLGWGGGRCCVTVGLTWVVLTRLAIKVDPLLGNAVTAGLALVAVPAGLGSAVKLATLGGPVARGLIAIGRSTPIYVLHPLVLRLLFIAFDRPEAVPKACWVLLLAALAIVASLRLGRWLSRVPGLFGLPSLPPFLAEADRPRGTS